VQQHYSDLLENATEKLKISIIVIIGGLLSSLRCTESGRNWLGLHPDPIGGAYIAPPGPLTGIEGRKRQGENERRGETRS